MDVDGLDSVVDGVAWVATKRIGRTTSIFSDFVLYYPELSPSSGKATAVAVAVVVRGRLGWSFGVTVVGALGSP